MSTPNDPAWAWDEPRWRKGVEKVRAGRPLRPKRWKDGARVCVALSFDPDHETSTLRMGSVSPGQLSQGEYGSRVGVPRILDLLKRHRIKASFFVPGVVALLHPDEQRRVVDEGHEVGMHGWIHEFTSELPRDVERDLMHRAYETLEKITGRAPVGVRCPSWDFSPNTLALEKELGLMYDSSLMADEDCYELLLHGEETGVIELPVEWVRDDAVYFSMHRFSSLRPYTPPADVLDIFRRELDAAYEDGAIFQLTMHPHIIGYRSRIWIVDELIQHAKSKGKVWFATHEQVARYAKEHAA